MINFQFSKSCTGCLFYQEQGYILQGQGFCLSYFPYIFTHARHWTEKTDLNEKCQFRIAMFILLELVLLKLKHNTNILINRQGKKKNQQRKHSSRSGFPTYAQNLKLDLFPEKQWCCQLAESVTLKVIIITRFWKVKFTENNWNTSFLGIFLTLHKNSL